MKICKICGYSNKDEAEICLVCKSSIDSSSVIRNDEPESPKKNQPKRILAAALLILIITCLVMIPIFLLLDSVLMVANPIPMMLGTALLIFGTLFLIYMTTIRSVPASTADATSQAQAQQAQAQQAQAQQAQAQQAQAQQAQAQASQQAQAQQPQAYGEDPVNSYVPKTQASPMEARGERVVTKAFICFAEKLSRMSASFTHPQIDFNDNATTADALTVLTDSTGLSGGAARAVLSAMACRRMIILCAENDEKTATALGAVSKLAGTAAIPVALGADCADSHTLLVEECDDRSANPSHFLSALAVGGGKEEICLIDLTAEAPESLSGAFGALSPCLVHPQSYSEVTVKGADRQYANISGDETVKIPSNRRIFLRVCTDRKIPIGAELLRNAAWIEIKDSDITPVAHSSEEEEKAPAAESRAAALSFARLVDLTDDSEKEYYISEEHWKRLDELCDFLEPTAGFRMDNLLATAIERFAGIYIASGGSEEQAIDAVIASLILPEALALLSGKEDRDYGPILEFIDGRFGLENLPQCSEFLKKYGTI